MLQTLNAKCPGCGSVQGFGVDDSPKILNLTATALYVLEHCGQFLCSGCGIKLQPTVVRIGGAIVGLAPVPKGQEQSLIVPVNGRL